MHSGVVHAHGIMFLAVCILNTAVCSRILHLTPTSISQKVVQQMQEWADSGVLEALGLTLRDDHAPRTRLERVLQDYLNRLG